MKKFIRKFILLLLALALLVPAAASADYTPALGMTMDTFMAKYNAIPASIGAPYSPLTVPYQWSVFQSYNVAWFHADPESQVTVLLLSEETGKGNTTQAGLDVIQIFTPAAEDFIPLISVTSRCAEIYAMVLFGESMAPLYLANVLRSYYETGAEKNGEYVFHTIDENFRYEIKFFKSEGCYFFEISPAEPPTY